MAHDEASHGSSCIVVRCVRRAFISMFMPASWAVETNAVMVEFRELDHSSPPPDKVRIYRVKREVGKKGSGL
jgi:hypothetical protein